MSFTITIAGTPIDFPSSAESPNWAPGIIEFAQAVEEALQGAVGTYDVSPQVFIGDTYNPGTDVDVPNLSFPNSNVRSAVINYAVYRTTDSDDAAESGIMNVLYNPNNSVGFKWELTREAVGDGLITFTITDSGQIQFTTESLSGVDHYMRISYSAKALEQV
jgi:hypothetical protein